MFRKTRRGVGQAAEIDDAFNSSSTGGVGKMASGSEVALVKIGSSAQAVDQIVGHVDPLHGRSETRRLEDVTRDDLNSNVPGSPLQPGRIAHQAADAIALLKQAWHKSPSNVAGGAGHQDDAMIRSIY